MNDNFLINEAESLKKNAKSLINPQTPENAKNYAKMVIRAFGLNYLKPKFYNVNVNASEPKERKIGDENSSYSDFGLPVFDVLDFDTVSYSTLVGHTKVIPPLSFATVLIDVTQSKNIVATPVAGRNGTIKEYISDGDYMITIKGVLVGDGIDVRPDNLKKHLILFCQAPVPINVASNLLDKHDILTIVIKEYNFPQIEGQRNIVPFELICLSETVFNVNQNA